MADGSMVNTPSLRGKVSEGEWQARVNLAALYRLVAYYGWDDLIFTHISARVPGPEHHFLINPYGLFFEEMTASALVKINLDGEIVQDTDYGVNAAGFTIHSAIHAAREDAKFVMHLHSDQGAAVSAQTEGLLPLTQHALTCIPRLAYHDYEGIALNLGERERIVADMGDKTMLLLKNHGTLTVGETAAQCWVAMWFLERACKQQVMALAGGREHALIAPKAAQEEVAMQIKASAAVSADLAWPGCLRLLDRKLPGYDA